MKFFHLSDLHFGKQLSGYDMTNQQREFIAQLKEYVKEEKPDAIVIAGDIYDKSVPSATAMTLLDELLTALAGTPVLMIAGNHDSAERLQYGKGFLESHQIYIAVLPPKNEEEYLQKVVLQDQYGEVNFYLLPFLKPGMVRNFLPKEAELGEEAVIRKLLEREQIDVSKRNVIIAHQFFINGKKEPQRCDSEQTVAVAGGLDAIDISVFEMFDYGALGHIHGPQAIGKEQFRYSGTPRKYSVSESSHEKSIVVVELGEKRKKPLEERESQEEKENPKVGRSQKTGRNKEASETQEVERNIRFLPLRQSQDVRKISGSFQEIIGAANEENRADYVSITITDEQIPEQLKELLEAYYDNILNVVVDNSQTRKVWEEEIPDLKEMSPYEAFAAFFAETMGRQMEEEEELLLQEIIGEEEKENR